VIVARVWWSWKGRPQMETALAGAGSHPLQMAGAVLKVYFEYYTVVPFLGGVITGILTGRACFKVAQAG
jgi:hypothetical protein